MYVYRYYYYYYYYYYYVYYICVVVIIIISSMIVFISIQVPIDRLAACQACRATLRQPESRASRGSVGVDVIRNRTHMDAIVNANTYTHTHTLACLSACVLGCMDT